MNLPQMGWIDINCIMTMLPNGPNIRSASQTEYYYDEDSRDFKIRISTASALFVLLPHGEHDLRRIH